MGLAVLAIGQTGCASIAKRLASLIEMRTQGDGAARPVRALKTLMIHGIGTHLPGHSGRLTEHLMQALEFDFRDEMTKEFHLSDPRVAERCTWIETTRGESRESAALR